MDLDKHNLTELENDDWGGTTSDSYVEQACYRLRYKPINEFSVEDLRIMIGQDIGLAYLIPMAIDRLKKDPFAEGMHYSGDLLCAVLRADTKYYKFNGNIKKSVEHILSLVESSLDNLDEIDRDTFVEAYEEAKKIFYKD